MAATRKLQGEIDRCLKKVTEGVETFEDIWQKVHNANNSNQKEKYEADLKKEIKKLQRLRDQIKSWIASAEIKDKTSLMDNRRLIETQMERFKVVERETKTKAYSKEGLGAAQKLDPAQREKDEISQWLQTSIAGLQLQIDQFESEVESLLAGKKKRLDKDKQDKMDDLKAKLERHKFHVTKLETLLRMLDNDSVDVDQIKKIKDDVEYYIESSQEPDFEENEYLYDDITGLDEVELSEAAGLLDAAGVPSVGTTESNNSNGTGGGSPTSITSTTSPIQSPTLNCSSTTTTASSTTAASATTTSNTIVASHNHSSESTSVDYSDTKKNKPENSITNTKVTPVKPTAVRANKVEVINSNSTIPNAVTPVQPTGLSTVTNSTANSNNNTSSQNKPLISSTPSKNTPLPQQAPSSASPGQVTTTTNLVPQASLNLQLGTAPIAFSVVAKANPASLENGPLSSMLTSSTITAGMKQACQIGIPLGGTSLLTNNVPSSQPSVLQNNTNSSQQPSQQLQQQNSTENHVMNSSATSNSISNCVSPTSSRASPTPSTVTSPPQQVMNGPTNLKNSSASTTAPNQSTPDLMSTIKNIAQDSISRTSIDSTGSQQSNPQSQPQPADTRQQPLQLQQQIQQQLQQQQNQQQPPYVIDSTTATTNGLNINANITNLLNSTSSNMKSTGTTEAIITPLLGVAPLGPMPLQKEHQVQFQMMEAAYYHLPTPTDSERLRTYLHRQPAATPPHFPQSQLPHSDTIEFFQRLSTETLFFIFYYMEGTKAQYLAAKALKKQSWRFHTKYMMWFQRHEEPKIINEEFEKGTYIYFDYEKWGQRKKEGFTFEYKYLEDKDLN